MVAMAAMFLLIPAVDGIGGGYRTLSERRDATSQTDATLTVARAKALHATRRALESGPLHCPFMYGVPKDLPLDPFVGHEFEDALLGREVGRCGSCRLGFERPMHSLVPPILLGVAWVDALGQDAELDPPDR